MTAWMERGNCVGTVDPEDFFPERGGVVTKEARLACVSCPVQAECLQYALDHDELGYWGGFTENQRQHMPGGRRDPSRRGPKSDDAVCRNGHPRNEANTLIRKNGKRLCRDCQRETSRRSKERAKAAAHAA